MRTDTRNRIHAALLRHPMTQPQLVAATGLSRATVIHALSELRLPVVAHTWPRQYTLDPDIPQLPSTVEGIVVKRKAGNAIPWPQRWDNAREKFGHDVALQRITPDADPAELAAAFENGASSLATIAEKLREVVGKPDWFEVMGGVIEGDNVTPIKKVKKSVDKPLSTT